jgi:hypothetical protein
MQQIILDTSNSDLYARGPRSNVSLNTNVSDNFRCFIQFKLIHDRPKLGQNHFLPRRF